MKGRQRQGSYRQFSKIDRRLHAAEVDTIRFAKKRRIYITRIKFFFFFFFSQFIFFFFQIKRENGQQKELPSSSVQMPLKSIKLQRCRRAETTACHSRSERERVREREKEKMRDSRECMRCPSLTTSMSFLRSVLHNVLYA